MNLDKISENLAKELNLSEHQVTQINRVQWKFLLDIMQSGKFESVSLIYLGKFFKNQKYDDNGKKRRRKDHSK